MSIWKFSLQKKLEHLQRNNQFPRVAIVGIGQELLGDDAAGIRVAQALYHLADGSEMLLVIDAGSAPENCTGMLRCFYPHLVLLVDAAHLNAAPGSVRLLAWQDITGISASTHTLPLHILATYLTIELECEVALLGIQPGHMAVGAPLSSAVNDAVVSTARALAELICNCCIWRCGVQPTLDCGALAHPAESALVGKEG